MSMYVLGDVIFIFGRTSVFGSWQAHDYGGPWGFGRVLFLTGIQVHFFLESYDTVSCIK